MFQNTINWHAGKQVPIHLHETTTTTVLRPLLRSNGTQKQAHILVTPYRQWQKNKPGRNPMMEHTELPTNGQPERDVLRVSTSWRVFFKYSNIALRAEHARDQAPIHARPGTSAWREKASWRSRYSFTVLVDHVKSLNK